MCRNCVVVPYPDRGRMCLDNGAFLANFSGCVQCRRKDSAKIDNRLQSSNTENEEQVTMQHKCDNCGHVIAEHEFAFRICGEYQEYQMECLLCGSSEDTVSIMPFDPRHERELY